MKDRNGSLLPVRKGKDLRKEELPKVPKGTGSFRDEKIVHGERFLEKNGNDQSVRKTIRAGDLFAREMPSRSKRKTLRFREVKPRGETDQEREGSRKREMIFRQVFRRESPRGQNAQESSWPCFESDLRSQTGAQLFRGE